MSRKQWRSCRLKCPRCGGKVSAFHARGPKGYLKHGDQVNCPNCQVNYFIHAEGKNVNQLYWHLNAI